MLELYEFEHELASGARGAVFRARERRTGRAVAIKVAPAAQDAQRDGPAGATAALPAEVHLIDASVPTVRRHWREGHLEFIVTDYARGGDLAAHTLPSTLVPLHTVLDVVARLAAALQHAHDRGVVHGDVKPGNIVFDAANGTAVLVDFPLAGQAPGMTPSYASPERLCGSDATTASDQYALGVTLYQLCCGRLPFSGRSRAEVAQRVVHAPHTGIGVHAPALPPALPAIIDTSLAKEPSGRYRSIGDMGRAVSTLLRAYVA